MSRSKPAESLLSWSGALIATPLPRLALRSGWSAVPSLMLQSGKENERTTSMRGGAIKEPVLDVPVFGIGQPEIGLGAAVY
nr:hypothetical protein [Mariniblastus sp.]